MGRVIKGAVVAAALVLVAGAAVAGQTIGRDGNGNVWTLNGYSTNNDNTVTVVVQANSPDGSVSVHKQIYDCSDMTYRTTAYREWNSAGRVIDTTPDTTLWIDIRVGTVSDKIDDIVCDR